MSWNERMRACMKARAMTQAQLARALGCTRGAVGHYLSGRRRPTLDQFAAIAAALGVSPAWLQYGEGAGAGTAGGAGEGVQEPAGGYRAEPRLRVVGTLGRTDNAARPASGPLHWRPPAEAVALRVTDDAYAPRLRARDLVVLAADPPPQPGEEVVVRDLQGRHTPYVLRQRGERLVLDPLAAGAPTVVIARDRVGALLRVLAILREPPPA